MTKPNTTEIIVILDRSGSMASCADDMRGGFDSFIAKQRLEPGECKVTLAQFDHVYEVVYTSRPISQVPPLVLEPRANTALLDAIGRTITETGDRLRVMPEAERPSRVLCLIITDGMENASTEFRHETIQKMIAHQHDKYQWEFVYLGANQDAFAVAQGFGITTSATYEQKTKGGVRAMFSLASNVARSYRGGQSIGGNMQAQYDALLVQEQQGGTTTPPVKV